MDGNEDKKVDDIKNEDDDVDGDEEDYVDVNYDNGDDSEFRSRTGTVGERHVETGRPIQ